MHRLSLLLSGRRDRQSLASHPRLCSRWNRLHLSTESVAAGGQPRHDHSQTTNGGTMKKLVLLTLVCLAALACSHAKNGPMAMATLAPTTGQTASGTVHF